MGLVIDETGNTRQVEGKMTNSRLGDTLDCYDLLRLDPHFFFFLYFS